MKITVPKTKSKSLLHSQEFCEEIKPSVITGFNHYCFFKGKNKLPQFFVLISTVHHIKHMFNFQSRPEELQGSELLLALY